MLGNQIVMFYGLCYAQFLISALNLLMKGERKSTNKYYPPDFDPNRHRSLNSYHGKHALGQRGKKADQGVITIRFEMPFNCWCLTCKNPIGMGVRYNAEKKKVGMYHSTPIYQFSMPCHLCAGTIVMQTDPKNFQYVILEGARRKVQKWDSEENEQVLIPDHFEKKKLSTDAMYHLEHDVTDKKKALEILPAIQEIQTDRLAHEDDFALNQIARKKFRETKQQTEEKLAKDNSLLSRLSLTGSQVTLLPETDEDSTMAKVILLTNSRRRTTTNPLNPMFLVRNKKLIVPASKNASTSVNIKQTTISTLKMTRSVSSDSVNHHPCKSTMLLDKCKDSGIKENQIHQQMYISSLADSHSSNNVTHCSVELVTYESSDDSHSNTDF
ncbi:hypothetical protein MN116_001524 [Schistosoma mekongi]|uniref:Coiled-coil domain-containing protein 130 n=1 Tax=Schistosoma mekongi TaxID=38744 RepID=A0AAE1ZHY6_SCHME|nr:hypothetical protein MN116_001524 [Schistosoma mekongi]